MFTFFKVKKVAEVLEEITKFPMLPEESLGLKEALGRYLAKDILAKEDLPPFSRATMDGYAVYARDTFGARESEPVILKIKGEIAMGEVPSFSLASGEAARIATGGMLPEGADAVVMLEYTEEEKGIIEVKRPVAPYENVIFKGEDFEKGTIVFPAGIKITPAVIGVLSGLGITQVEVGQRPKVGILSTGDELVLPEKELPLGKIRDINSYTLYSASLESGAIPTLYGIVPDVKEKLFVKVEKAIQENDVLLISGGSSVGTRDFTLEAISRLPEAELICHGVAVKPGKPTILGQVGSKAIFGLPGQVASALLIFYIMVRPLLLHMQGAKGEHLFLRKIMAYAARNIPSTPGREDYVRVKLSFSEKGVIALPILKKSGLISSMAEAHGFLRIPENSEGIYEGELAEVFLLP
ncbi:molybdenum cofactor synthesis domain protein [Thermodesulfatator indicus DSM 15286]|uniref:Molybdopterin molybdenumtransferase n=2 Tax=Thermodesulfatator indicus TaxID=171695 RepID=F8AC09_THEID|nr:molybdenum cofactor synthesis domain protein [Thermodesulfatator indicus DSM 15286]